MTEEIVEDVGEDNEMEEIEEEYSIWKENIPFLYDLMLEHALVWPSLTLTFLPFTEIKNDKRHIEILFSTHTSGQDTEFLVLAELTFPINQKGKKLRAPGLKLLKKIVHLGEATKTRYMPQDASIVGSKGENGMVQIFNIEKQRDCAEVNLKGHNADGFGLDWNYQLKGLLASCGEDCVVNIWDINKPGQIMISFAEEDSVEDISWNKKSEHILFSVGDGKNIIAYDIRDKKISSKKENAHEKEIYSIDFHPFTEYLFVTGSGDCKMKLWDSRNLSDSVAIMRSHKDEILGVQWSPMNEHLVASASADRRAGIWDISKFGVDNTEEESADGPPELLFMHAGHKSKLNDLAWSPVDGLMLATTEENNNLHIWNIMEEIYKHGDENIPEELLE